MKITREQFNKAQKTFSKKSLSDIQKHIILSNIYSESEVAITRPVVSSSSSYFVFFRQKVFVAVAVVILLVSGTSYASAKSLPGDLLYGMKVNVIEPIGLALRFNEKSKNEYKISLLQKRVEELEKLKERGNINEDSQKASSEATNKNIKELEHSAIFDEKGGNVDVSEKLETYNNLIDAKLKIETNIKIDDNKELDVTEQVDIKEETTGDSDSGINEVDIEVENQDDLPLNVESDSVIETEMLEL